jgi:DNA-binding MarR family transcriptional regulator
MQARLLQDELSSHGVSGGCWYFLRVLWNEDALTQRELSVRTGVNEATARIAVDRMETEKLVVREQDQHDRRKWIIRLTTRGKNLEPQLISLALKLNIQAMGGFSSLEQTALIDRLCKIHQNLKKMQPKPPGRVRSIAPRRLSSPATELLGADSD